MLGSAAARQTRGPSAAAARQASIKNHYFTLNYIVLTSQVYCRYITYTILIYTAYKSSIIQIYY